MIRLWFRTFSLTCLASVIMLLGVAHVSNNFRNHAAELGLLAPSTSPHVLALPAVNGMGMGFPSLLIFFSGAALITTVIHTLMNVNYTWDSHSATEPIARTFVEEGTDSQPTAKPVTPPSPPKSEAQN